MIKAQLTFFTCYLLLGLFMGFSQGYEERLAVLEDKAYEHFYSNKDSTYFYFSEINKLTLSNKQVVAAIDNLNYVCFSAGYFYDLNKIKSTIQQTDKLIKENAKVLDTLSDNGAFQKQCLSFNKGNYFHKLEDFQKAESYFDEVAQQITIKPNYQNNIDDLDLLSQSYNFIAQMNVVQRRYKLASEYYEKNIRLFQRFKPNNLEGLYKVYNLYGNSLYEEGKYDKAKNLWLTSLNFHEKNFSVRNRNSIVTTTLLLSKVYTDLHKTDSASYYLNKTKKYKVNDDPFMDRYLIAEGEIHLKESNYSKALLTYKKALDLSLENNKPRLRKRIGDLYLKIADSEKALVSYQKGIIEISSDFSSNTYLNNPDPVSVKQKSTLLSLLAAKATALAKQNDTASQSAVLSTVDTGLKTLDLLKPTFKNQNDKLSLIENAFKLFETGIETGYQLHKIKPSPEYINTVFKYFEKSKSVLLLEALLGAKATQFTNIPDTLIERELQLKSEITFVQKQLVQSATPNNEIEDQLFELQEEHRQLINKIETEYKDYFNLKYRTETLSFTDTQKLLKPNEKMISYFYGNQAIYAIGIDKNSKHIERIPIDSSIEDLIKKVHSLLGNSKSSLNSLNTASYQLYKTLVAPFIMSGEKKELIVITDGLLNYIPFAALNTDENGLSYLIEKCSVSYASSATLYAQLLDRNSKKGDLLAFAPSFSGEPVQINPSRDNLLPLPHNKKEVAQILNSFKGRSFINESASLQNFTSKLSNSRILHLATHAVFDDAAPEYSYLAFSSKNDQENLLYVNDLYNLQIDADLVTLSACESGIGDLKRGEGFLSLAHGFFFSGASSITSTLWKINDASTSTLMDAFYKNLSEGDSKHLALQKAQNSFLERNRQNGLSHPYYWSGFIISGNTKPLISVNYWIWIGLGILLIVVGGLFVFKNNKEV